MTTVPVADGERTVGPGRARGQNHGRARLEDHEVIEIRTLAGRLPHGAIAARFGVTRTTVLSIIHRYTWQHLEPES